MKRILATLNIGNRILLGFSLLILLFLGIMIMVELVGIPGTAIQGRSAVNRSKSLNDLELASGLLSERVSNWFAGRRIDVSGLSVSPLLRNAVENRNTLSKSQITAELEAFLKSHPDIDSVAILDSVNASVLAARGTFDKARSAEDIGISPDKFPRFVITGYQETLEIFQFHDKKPHLLIVSQMLSTDEPSQHIVALLVALSNMDEALRPIIWSIRNDIISHEWECVIATAVDNSISQFHISKSGINSVNSSRSDISKSGPTFLALSGMNGPYEGPDQFGKQVLAFHRQINIDRGTSLGLVLEVDSQTVLKDAQDDLNRQLLLWLALFGTGFVLCFFLTKQIVRPVKELAVVALKIEAGDLSVRAAEGNHTEVGQLATVFNGMVDKIASWQRELEKQVAERTRDLRKLSDRQEALLSAVPDIIMEADVNRFYTWANSTGTEFFGDDVIGKEVAFYFVGEQNSYEIVQPLFEGIEKSLYVESWQRRRDGEIRLLAWWYKALMDEHGVVSGTLSTARDITENKRAEEALLESENKLQIVFKRCPIGLFLLNNQAVVLDCNQSLLNIFGVRREEYIGLNLLDRIPEGPVRKSLVDAISSDGVHGYEGLYTSILNGKQLYISVSCEQIAPNLIIAIIMDITERKQAEAEKAELEAQNRQLQKAESLGHMAGAIAHHFNNQLNVVMGNLEMAMDDLPLGENSNENLVSAMQAARKAADVSRLMLTYLGQTPGKHVPIDLSESCRQSLTFLQAAAPMGILIKANLPSSGPSILADASHIQQVLTNLITNAWEAACENKGTVHLTVKTFSHADIPSTKRFPIDWQPQETVYACLEVADTGCGISNKDIEKIFDPFFTTKFTGRGLGLPVVMGIVKAHGGGVTVESEPGKGSVMRVFLPISTEEVSFRPNPPAMPEAQLTVKAEIISKIEGGGTVLLIEDEEQVRNMAKKMLTRLGYTVFEAKDGVEAVDIFQKHQDEILCVLSDLTMPRMNGWETLAALRKISPIIPVILSSGYDEAHVMVGEHTERPNAFLGKPYQLKGLRDTINRVLSAPAGK